MRLEDVWLRYRRGQPWVLRGVGVRLDPGQAVTVTGRNGAGKSTLLKVAAGVLRAQRGTVRDRPAHVGYVPERFPADQPFTARRYLISMAGVRGQPAAEAHRAVAAWAERLHFTGLLDTPLPELSKGSAQKVGLMQALLRPPDLLILDEPWEGLDAATRAEIPRIIADAVRDGGRVLISDHVGGAGELSGMRRWELAGGVLVETGDNAAECVVELALAASDVASAVATLRAAGHRVVDVRVRAAESAP